MNDEPMKATPEQPADLDYDPYDYKIDANPHPVWRRLREEAPLYFNERHQFYALSRYQDVLDGLQDWHTFSSAAGRCSRSSSRARQPNRRTKQRWAISGSMIFSDPPGHDIARHIVNREFTPRKVGHLEGRLRKLCRAFLDQLDGRSEFDFVGDFAGRIPPMIIGDLLGVPEEDQEQLGHWVDMFMYYDPSAETGETIQGVMQFNEIRAERDDEDGRVHERSHRRTQPRASRRHAFQVARRGGRAARRLDVAASTRAR